MARASITSKVGTSMTENGVKESVGAMARGPGIPVLCIAASGRTTPARVRDTLWTLRGIPMMGTGTKICGTVMASCIAHPVLSTMDNGSKMCQKEEVSQFIL